MRRTIGETKEALEFLEKIEALDKEQRDEFARIIKLLIRCFYEEDVRAMIVFNDGAPLTKVMALNCDEMTGAKMVQGLRNYLEFTVMEDAPPKEMFN